MGAGGSVAGAVRGSDVTELERGRFAGGPALHCQDASVKETKINKMHEQHVPFRIRHAVGRASLSFSGLRAHIHDWKRVIFFILVSLLFRSLRSK